jgi:hypothetical protein
VEFYKLSAITDRINAGFSLEEILDGVYREFQGVIPYNRIGIALLSEDGVFLTARWARSDQPEIFLGEGYSARMEDSSLSAIISNNQPRIINDLEAYLDVKPHSVSTQLIVREGMRSSLTCPLIAQGKKVGFLFFSSVNVNAYADTHVELYSLIAGQLSMMVEKGRLVSRLEDQNHEIERNNIRLRELNRFKNTILGIAAHDLRNPLSYVRTTVDILTGPDAEMYEQDREVLFAGIGRQTNHMLSLIDNLLDFTEIESGKLKLDLRRLEIQDFLSDLVKTHQLLAKSKQTQITLQVSRSMGLLADPHRLRQAMDNLISNAVKYSPPGSLIQVHAGVVAEGYRIEVIDEGPGILLKDRGRLFEAFTKLSAKPTAGERSTGLGLAITKWIIMEHGGEIGVDSTPGKGATFWVVLPVEENG